MKRSEMVEKVCDYLWNTEHLDIPCSLGSDFKQAAKDIVTLIEKAGMLPPKTNCDPRDEYFFDINEWEPEDG